MLNFRRRCCVDHMAVEWLIFFFTGICVLCVLHYRQLILDRSLVFQFVIFQVFIYWFFYNTQAHTHALIPETSLTVYRVDMKIVILVIVITNVDHRIK